MVAGGDSLEALLEGATALGLALDAGQAERFAAYAALLLEWNGRFNLLGPAAVRELWRRHLLDALTLVLALPREAPAASLALLDVGSGAGLPGIPLAIAFPGWQVTLLEATAKKARFLDLAARELGLPNLEVVGGRAEDLAHDRDLREGFDLCVARAVATAPALVEITLPFVAPGGSAILYRGLTSLSEELQQAEPARVLLGAGPPAVTPVTTAPDDARCLVRYVKLTRTPRPLPRAAGLPEHRPLDAREAARIGATLAAEAAARRARGGGRQRRRH